MVTASEIATLIRAIGLDAEGTNHYDDDLHIIPAINSALRWIYSVAARAMHDKRLAEEAFGEALVIQVYQTNAYSRIAITEDLYSLVGVYPNPTCYPNSDPDLTGADYDSVERTDLYFISSDNSCKRLTLEEWNFHKGNPFKAGNTVQTSTLETTQWAYLSNVDYGTIENSQPGTSIEIRPALNRKLVAIAYLETPDEVVDLADEIPIRAQLKNLLAEKAIHIISYRQGDKTTVYSVTDKDVSLLVEALT